ncbi:MAG: DUF393 domain-containing protein [Candidatus Sumerlaeia bacterium]|nr:DUF393 domain-containing protein [Candidatus Sumerlaeia bacterium]
MEQDRVLVVYDGECGFCRANVALLRSLPGADRLEFLASQSGEAQRRHPRADWSRLGEAIHAVRRDGAVFAGPMAIAAVLDELGPAARAAARLLRWEPAKPLAEGAYRVVAENRHRLPGAKKD